MEQVFFKMLPTQLIIDGFINNRDDSYEDYLLEFVNASRYFLEKSNGEVYSKPNSEAHGECDCNSKNYSLDFKMLISRNVAQGKREFTSEIIEYCPGVHGFGEPRVTPKDSNYKPIQGCSISYLFRNHSVKELLKLCEHEKTINPLKQKDHILQEDKELLEILKVIGKKKNIFAMLPYELICDSSGDDAKKLVFNQISQDYNSLFLFRKAVCPEYDTYIGYVYKDMFFLSSFDNGNAVLLEEVPLSCSPTFSDLYNIRQF